LSPKGPTRKGGEGSREKGWLLYSHGKYQLAVEELQKALVGAPDDPIGHAYLALAYTALKRDKQALEESARAIQLGPERDYTHYVRSFILGKKAKIKEALKSIEEAIRLNPRSPAYFELLSQIRFAQKEWKPALEAAEKGLSFNPEHIPCLEARIQALIQLDRREDAEQASQALLALDPENPDAHGQKGALLLREGKYDEAVRVYEEALRLNPLDGKSREGLARALKSRYPFYSWFLHFLLWSERLDGKTRTALTIGFFLLVRISGAVGKDGGPWVGVAAAIFLLGLMIVMGSFLADPLFNLVLCLTPAGRVVLGEDRVRKFKWVGSCLGLGIALVLTALLAQTSWLGLAALWVFLGIIPVLTAFDCPPEGRARRWMIYYGSTCALLGAGWLLIEGVFHPGQQDTLDFVGFCIGFLALVGILLGFGLKNLLIRRFGEN
jgi:cytochrome c-type biogenesis protein CcmH/NrfG